MTYGSQAEGFPADSHSFSLFCGKQIDHAPKKSCLFKLLEFSFKHKIHRASCLKWSISLCASGDTAETGNLHDTEKIKHGKIKAE